MIKIPTQILKQDPVLYRVVKATRLEEYVKKSGVFESLVSSIISQQLSVKAASTIFGRFSELCDDQIGTQRVLALSIEEMRAAGLSRQKSAYVQNIATFFSDDEYQDYTWEDATPEHIVKVLTQIKGVGVWTVQMVMMFQLDKQDIFPVGDLGIQQKMKHLYDLDGKRKEIMLKMEKIAENWSPYRSIASKYLWKYEIK